MANKEPISVRSLNGFMRWTAQFEDGQYLFRGVSNDTYKIEASAYRRLPSDEEKSPAQLLKVNQDLIDKARLLGHDQKNGQRLSDLELLAQLQHYGAATCLIDFTRNALVALWMACQHRTKRNGTNGKVFAVRSDSLAKITTIMSQSQAEENIDSFFEERDKGYFLYRWQPKYQNNRIIAQQSVFVFGGAEVEVEAECVILKSGKEDLLKSLSKVLGITEASIYPDFDGFARLHASDKPYSAPDAQDNVQRGVQTIQDDKLDDTGPPADEDIVKSDPKGELR